MISKAHQKKILMYYASDEFKPILPSDTSFRHFRFKKANKSWRKVPFKIDDPDELKRWILKFGGLDLYYGTSTWMNPHRISTRGGRPGTFLVADNLMLNNDLVLDIDAPEPITMEKLETSRKVTKRLHKIMTKDGYKLDYCAFSGYKGFRLAYKNKLEIPLNPLERLGHVERLRKIFIDELLNKVKSSHSARIFKETKEYLDAKITTDPMRVIRIVGSVHSTTGYVSTKVPVLDLNTKNIKQLLRNVPNIYGKGRSGIPKREMTAERQSVSRPRLESLAEDVSDLASLPFDPEEVMYYITNRVLGIKKGYVPFFIYSKSQKYYEDELVKLQKKHGLGDIFISQFKDKIIGVSLKIMQKRNLEKVLYESSSIIKKDFKKYRVSFMPWLRKDIKVIPGVLRGQASAAHSIFFGRKATTRSSGWDKLELVRANN